MKRFLICLLVAGAVFPLAAQTSQRAAVYMPSVTGTGSEPRDNTFFFITIYQQLSAQPNITMGTNNNADFTLSGTLAPFGISGATSNIEFSFTLSLRDNRTGQIISDQRYRYDKLENAEVAIKLMVDNVLAAILAAQRTQQQPTQPAQQQPTQPAQQQPTQPAQQQPTQPLQQQPTQPVQQQPTQPAQQQPTQPAQQQPTQPAQQQPTQPAQQQPTQPVQQQPTQPVQQQPTQPVQQQPVQQQPTQQPPVQPPAAPEYEDDWRDRWLFFNLSAAWAPRVYRAYGTEMDEMSVNPLNLGFGFYPELRVLDSVALETGFGLARDAIRVVVSPQNLETEVFPDFMLEIPLLLKIVLKPGDTFLLEPYSGIGLNFSLMETTRPSRLSWIVGYQHGVSAGPGGLFFDFRFSMDLATATLAKRPDITYQRYGLQIGVGYKYGIIPRR